MAKVKWLVGFLIILLVGMQILNTNQDVAADDGTGTERYFSQNLNTIRYSWNVLSNTSNKYLCQVKIYHEGQPTPDEIRNACINPQDPLSPTLAQIESDTKLLLVSSELLQQYERVPIPAIHVDLSVPNLPVATPFVTITAIEPLSDYWITRIYGTLNGQSFECPKDACRLILTEDSELTVWARSSLGDDSQPVSATIDLTQTGSVYSLKIVKTSYKEYQDSCSEAWQNVSLGGSATWQGPLISADALYTENRLHLLAAKLIQNKIVNASSCPNGGLLGVGTVNSCGMDTALPAVIEWQNRFNNVIFAAAQDTGIPAKMLKSVIEQETQFWPGNVRSDYLEFGFGQMTDLGADVALRWDPELNAAVCEGLLFDCGKLFASQSESNQSMLRGGLMRWFDTDCPDCKYGVDISKAERSIKPLAQIVRANCRQVAYVMERQLPKASYETLWSLTMLSYHSGYECMENGIKKASIDNLDQLTWSRISNELFSCPSAADYISDLWSRLDTYSLYNRAVKATPIVATPIALNTPTPTPTRTPRATQPAGNRTLTPTPVSVVNGTIGVDVYIDTNNNEIFDEGEGIENIKAVARFSDNTTLDIQVLNGNGSVEFYNKIADREVTVSLPSLYRSISTVIPRSGIVRVVFRISPAALPTVMP